VELAEPCEVKDAELLATANPGDVVNVNDNLKTHPWRELAEEIKWGAEYDVIAHVAGEKIPLPGGVKGHDLDVGHKAVRPAMSDTRAEVEVAKLREEARELGETVVRLKEVIGAQAVNVASVIESIRTIDRDRLKVLDRTRLTGVGNALCEIARYLSTAK
jgi:hypothetical protein